MDPLITSFSPPPTAAPLPLHRSSSALRSPESVGSPPPFAASASGTISSNSRFGSAPVSSTFRQPQVYGDPGMAIPDPSSSVWGSPLASHAEIGVAGASGSTAAGIQDKGKEKEKEAERRYLRVRITGLERNRKDLLVRFDASTNLPNFRTGIYRNMQRSYVEFQKFAEQAQLTSPQTIIPALPLASTSATTDEEDDRLVRIALQRWLSRVCDDPALMDDQELRSFIESDFGYSPTPPPTARRPTSAASAVPLFTAAISKVVRRGPLDEDDELASAKGALEKLETTWAGAAAAINNLGKARRAHAIANQEVGAKLVNLSTVESDYHLAAAERKAGRANETLAGVAGAQSASENIVLSDSLGYQALNARAAKDALIQRTQLLEDAQTATKSTITKRRNVERLKGSSSINPIKVDDAISEMEDAEQLERQLSKQLEAISANLHLSLRHHSRNTHEDVALALLENARLTVGFHKHTLRELEAVRPDLAKVGSDKGSDVLTAAANVDAGPLVSSLRSGLPPTMAPTGQALPASASTPHMTGSRPYDSALPPSSPASGSRTQGMGTSQSMFLPPPPHGVQTQQQQRQNGTASNPSGPQQQHTHAKPPPLLTTQNPALDPLGGNQMSQSMVLPPGHRPGSAAGSHGNQGGRPAGRRLDERQAARMLAGGF